MRLEALVGKVEGARTPEEVIIKRQTAPLPQPAVARRLPKDGSLKSKAFGVASTLYSHLNGGKRGRRFWGLGLSGAVEK